MGRHPATVIDPLIGDDHRAAIGELDVDRVGRTPAQRGAQIVVVAVRIERKRSGGNARIEQIADGAADPDAARIDAIHLHIAIVPYEQPVLRVEQAKALRHVVESRVEMPNALRDRDLFGIAATSSRHPPLETGNPTHAMTNARFNTYSG